jgi:hypothetical protein
MPLPTRRTYIEGLCFYLFSFGSSRLWSGRRYSNSERISSATGDHRVAMLWDSTLDFPLKPCPRHRHNRLSLVPQSDPPWSIISYLIPSHLIYLYRSCCLWTGYNIPSLKHKCDRSMGAALIEAVWTPIPATAPIRCVGR